jgi:hypothetical protein
VRTLLSRDQATVDCLHGWQEAGHLDQEADLYAMAAASVAAP